MKNQRSTRTSCRSSSSILGEDKGTYHQLSDWFSTNGCYQIGRRYIKAPYRKRFMAQVREYWILQRSDRNLHVSSYSTLEETEVVESDAKKSILGCFALLIKIKSVQSSPSYRDTLRFASFSNRSESISYVINLLQTGELPGTADRYGNGLRRVH